MTTTVVKTIGTGTRDYSTIALWWAGCPVSLVAVDQIWEGDCYNDSEFLITAAITFSGVTTSTTQYPHLTTGSGQSFADNANKLTNALVYNQANGVGVRTTTGYITMFTVSVPNMHIDKLQVYRNTNKGSNTTIIDNNESGTTLNQLIVESDAGAATVQLTGAASNTISNSLITMKGNAANIGLDMGYPGTGCSAVNCTIAKPSDDGGAGTGIRNRGGGFSNLLVENCAVFGWGTTGSAGTYATGSDYNGVPDATSPFGGTHNQTSLTYASQFQTVTDAARDYRAVSTGSLDLNATPDSTHTGGIDIVGQTRSGTTPTIGAWEIVSGGGTSISATSALETWAGKGASLNAQTNVAASAGLETWSGKSATVAANTNVSASAAIETWSGKASTVQALTQIAANAALETWAGNAATVLVSGPTTITANSALETWSGQAASVQIGGAGVVLKNRVFRSKKHVIYGG